jgi:hypothetical protein
MYFVYPDQQMDITHFIEKNKLTSIDLKKYDEPMINQMNLIVGGSVEPTYDHPILCRLSGLYFMSEKKYDQAERYYLMALEKEDDIINNLGMLCYVQKKYDQAEQYFLMGVKKGNTTSMCNLGRLHTQQKKYDQAEKYFLMGVELEHTPSICGLGKLYYIQEKYDQAEQYFLMGVERGDEQSMCGLESLHSNKLQLYNTLTKATKNDLIDRTMRVLEKNKQILFFRNKRKRLSEVECCPICYEEKPLIPRDCAHYYCTECYVRIDRCSFGCDNE